MKKDESGPIAPTWMDPKGITPSEIRRREANTTCSPSHTESKQNGRISKTEIETDVQEQADACQSGGGGGGRWESKRVTVRKKVNEGFL